MANVIISSAHSNLWCPGTAAGNCPVLQSATRWESCNDIMVTLCVCVRESVCLEHFTMDVCVLSVCQDQCIVSCEVIRF